MTKKLLILIFLILLPASMWFLPIFKVSSVQIEQNSPCLGQEQVEYIKGQRIFLLNTKIVIAKIKKDFPCAENVSIGKKIFSKIIIKITASEPVARLENTNLAITPSGQVTDAGAKTMPVLYSSKAIGAAKNQILTDPELLISAKIAKTLEKSDFTAASIRPTEEGVAVYGQDNIFALFSYQKDIDLQTDSLQQVMARAKIDASKISKIDLRFDKPIIVFK